METGKERRSFQRDTSMPNLSGGHGTRLSSSSVSPTRRSPAGRPLCSETELAGDAPHTVRVGDADRKFFGGRGNALDPHPQDAAAAVEVRGADPLVEPE